MTTRERIREIVEYERQAGRDSVEAVRDYFAEKDSHFTHAEVEQIIERAALTVHQK